MPTRREALFGGLGLVLGGVLPGTGRRAAAAPPPAFDVGAEWFAPNAPFKKIASDASVLVDGLPFASGLTGDPFPDPHLRFPTAAEWFRERRPPTPTETVDVAVVGGGISGLSSAYLLRAHDPVLFELNPRFGGSARGEWWGGVPYSLGGAYVITPDPGTFLESFYAELGLDQLYRLDAGVPEIELDGDVTSDRFWSGKGLPKSEQLAFARYAEVVTGMAEKTYPDIPVDPGPAGDWVCALDLKTFKQDIEEQMGLPVPPLLASAIQAYCYSSFGAGWEEISAASGWNFLAAEEFGRWVFPGGNAQMAYQMWRALEQRETPTHHGLRSNALVVDVRLHPGGAQVTWADHGDQLHALVAKKVVMACPKNVCKRVLWQLDRLDPQKLEAMHHIHHSGYVVANVLLDAPVELDFYDIFLLGDGSFPMSSAEAEAQSRVVDVLSGHFARGPRPGPRSVLTLYWPLPWPFGQHTLLMGDATWRSYATRLAPQVRQMLRLLEVPERSIRQIRMTSFGHSMPIAMPGFIGYRRAEDVRRPIEDTIYFVQQDNWALPAVENCLLDAEAFAPLIAGGL